jgi:hypothetical protein
VTYAVPLLVNVIAALLRGHCRLSARTSARVRSGGRTHDDHHHRCGLRSVTNSPFARAGSRQGPHALISRATVMLRRFSALHWHRFLHAPAHSRHCSNPSCARGCSTCPLPPGLPPLSRGPHNTARTAGGGTGIGTHLSTRDTDECSDEDDDGYDYSSDDSYASTVRAYAEGNEHLAVDVFSPTSDANGRWVVRCASDGTGVGDSSHPAAVPTLAFTRGSPRTAADGGSGVFAAAPVAGVVAPGAGIETPVGLPGRASSRSVGVVVTAVATAAGAPVDTGVNAGAEGSAAPGAPEAAVEGAAGAPSSSPRAGTLARLTAVPSLASQALLDAERALADADAVFDDDASRGVAEGVSAQTRVCGAFSSGGTNPSTGPTPPSFVALAEEADDRDVWQLVLAADAVLSVLLARTAVGVLIKHLCAQEPAVPTATAAATSVPAPTPGSLSGVNAHDDAAAALQLRVALVADLTPMRSLLSFLTVAKLCLFRGAALPVPMHLRPWWMHGELPTVSFSSGAGRKCVWYFVSCCLHLPPACSVRLTLPAGTRNRS